MKGISSVIAIAAAVVVCARSSMAIEGSILVDGQCYVQVVPNERIQESPDWDPLTDRCPLEPGKAARLALHTLKAAIPGVTYAEVDHIGLMKEVEGKWLYMVQLYLTPKAKQFWESDGAEGSRGDADYATLFVCMDGTAGSIVKANTQDGFHKTDAGESR
jgi:hypothetical protein